MPRSWREVVSLWLPAVLVMAVIFYLSSQSHLPSPPDSLLNTISKKLGHVTAYSILALAYLRAVHRLPRAFLLAWLLASLFAVSDEYHQSLVPLRRPSFLDIVIDASSAAVTLGAVRWLLVERSDWLGALVRKLTLVKSQNWEIDSVPGGWRQ